MEGALASPLLAGASESGVGAAVTPSPDEEVRRVLLQTRSEMLIPMEDLDLEETPIAAGGFGVVRVAGESPCAAAPFQPRARRRRCTAGYGAAWKWESRCCTTTWSPTPPAPACTCAASRRRRT